MIPALIHQVIFVKNYELYNNIKVEHSVNTIALV